MMYLACGLNAHGQLKQTTRDDIFLPTRLDSPCKDGEPDIIFAGWSETVCQYLVQYIRSYYAGFAQPRANIG